MEFVRIKNKSNSLVSASSYGKVKPGETIEVTKFDYEGAFKNDDAWELVVIKTPKVDEKKIFVAEPEEAKAKTEAAVEEIRKQGEKKQKSSKIKE